MPAENLDYFYQGRVLNFAHRGASARAPANTLSAFRLAAELGADGVELDVQLSKDGAVVVIHDFTVDATTDGSGPVAEKKLAELQALDAGSWFDAAFAGEHIPTLQEVMDAVGYRLLLNIELKLPFTLVNTGLEAEVVRLIEDNNLVDRVIVSSFHPLALRRVKSLNPRIPTGLLYAHNLPIYLRRAWLAPLAPHEARHPDFTMVTPAYVRAVKARGYRINVWTVDDPDEMCRLLDLGVDAIITNRPDVLRQVAGGWVGS
ncbi:MAG: glycerophosphodiester phosphodiesterase [Anaerolineae bacterium]|jgi:glycerophosphoryl diester phosphodiesterase|nr:glycerophosphodiester phosphodiesterase [Anaerolineae bacterium]MDH7472493.1 glycerophosphodiester phosphodiesterase [Anaerolineae bacterium]